MTMDEATVFYAPVGSDPTDASAFTPIGFHTGIGFGDPPVEQAWRQPFPVGGTYTFRFGMGPIPPRLFRILFDRRPPKRVRKAWVRSNRQAEKRERDLYREDQRRAIGIPAASRS